MNNNEKKKKEKEIEKKTTAIEAIEKEFEKTKNIDVLIEKIVCFLINHYSENIELTELLKRKQRIKDPLLWNLIDDEIKRISSTKKVLQEIRIDVDTKRISLKYKGNAKSPDSWQKLGFAFPCKEFYERIFEPPYYSYSAPREILKIFSLETIKSLDKKNIEMATKQIKKAIDDGKAIGALPKLKTEI